MVWRGGEFSTFAPAPFVTSDSLGQTDCGLGSTDWEWAYHLRPDRVCEVPGAPADHPGGMVQTVWGGVERARVLSILKISACSIDGLSELLGVCELAEPAAHKAPCAGEAVNLRRLRRK